MSMIKIKLVKSPIGYNKKQKAILNGLGLSRLNQVRELQDTPCIRGMVFKVKHLVEADPADAAQRKS